MKNRLLMMFAALLAGCPSDDASICGNGDEVSVDGQDYCVYRYSVVVENGFECPPERPNLTQEGGIGICAEQEMIPAMQVERIGREYREISPGYEACVLDFDCDTGEACRAGSCELLNSNNTNSNTNNTNANTNSATNSQTNNGTTGDTCANAGDCEATQTCENGVCVSSCGGFAGFQCARTEWCDYEDGTMCGAGDMIGICRPRPDACTDEVDPVCGCDGMDYSNGCEANAAGVDVSTAGTCN